MKLKSKIIAYCLSVALIITLIPDFSFAEDEAEQPESVQQEQIIDENYTDTEEPADVQEEPESTEPEEDVDLQENDMEAASVPEPKTPSMKMSTSLNLSLLFSWAMIPCNGYEIHVYKKGDFEGGTTFTIEDPTILNYSVSRLFGKRIQDSTTYYARIRSFNLSEGETPVYSKWSLPSRVKTKGTGWYKKDGLKYYYKRGRLLTGRHIIKKNPYYFDKHGVLRGTCRTMWKKVRHAYSGRKYLIAVDTTDNRLCVYKGSADNWVLYKYVKCSTGRLQYRSHSKRYTSKTPCRSWMTYEKRGRYKHFGEEDGHTCWYCTRLGKAPSNYFFHSIIYRPYSKSRVKDGRLGKNVSAGCIRLAYKNAKWIYYNAKPKTKIITLRHPRKKR